MSQKRRRRVVKRRQFVMRWLSLNVVNLGTGGPGVGGSQGEPLGLLLILTKRS